MKTLIFGDTASFLKPLHEVDLPDPRWKFTTGDLERIHSKLSTCVLHAGCPESVRFQFEIARNLALYSWHVFEFFTVAELQGHAALEHALRTCMPEFAFRPRLRIARAKPKKAPKQPKPVYLEELLRVAHARGIMRPSELPAYRHLVSNASNRYVEVGQIPIPTPNEWFEQLVLSISDMRNPLAHGYPHLAPGFAFEVLALTADIINQLFPEPAASTVE